MEKVSAIAYENATAYARQAGPGPASRADPAAAAAPEESGINVYVLELDDGCYYVGRTSDPMRRFREHFSGESGSAWTRAHRPKRVCDFFSGCDKFDEDKYTKIYMSQHGVDRVRGGSHSQIDMQPGEREQLERELRGADDRCFACGAAGHFVADCPSWKPGNTVRDDGGDDCRCYRCGMEGHWSRQCRVPEDELPPSSSSDDDDCDGPDDGETGMPEYRSGVRSSDTCYECGGRGHWASDCPSGGGEEERRRRWMSDRPSGAGRGHWTRDCPRGGRGGRGRGCRGGRGRYFGRRT